MYIVVAKGISLSTRDDNESSLANPNSHSFALLIINLICRIDAMFDDLCLYLRHTHTHTHP